MGIAPREIFRSVEDVWAVWVASIVLLGWLARATLRGLRRQDGRRLLAGEEGAAYALGYVMTMPIYLFLVCLIIEATLILVVKMGTVHAAYAAARSGVVWAPFGDGRAREKAEAAAMHAMVPFASSSSLHASGGAGGAGGGSQYYLAYKRFASGPAPASYILAKYRLAARATRARLRRGPAAPDGDLTATVTYEMPLNVPGVARLLGRPSSLGGPFYSRTITSAATLPCEGPRNDRRTLGIGYDPG